MSPFFVANTIVSAACVGLSLWRRDVVTGLAWASSTAGWATAAAAGAEVSSLSEQVPQQQQQQQGESLK